MPTYEERIQQIHDHFANISMEKFEANLERAGMKPNDSSPARGIINGLIISIPIWIVIGLIVWWVIR